MTTGRINQVTTFQVTSARGAGTILWWKPRFRVEFEPREKRGFAPLFSSGLIFPFFAWPKRRRREREEEKGSEEAPSPKPLSPSFFYATDKFRVTPCAVEKVSLEELHRECFSATVHAPVEITFRRGLFKASYQTFCSPCPTQHIPPGG